MDILAKSIGCLWPLGIISVSTIMSGLLSEMAITFIWKLVNVVVQQIDI